MVNGDNIIYITPEDISNCLGQHFSSTSSTGNYTQNFQKLKLQAEQPWEQQRIFHNTTEMPEDYNLPITQNEPELLQKSMYRY